MFYNAADDDGNIAKTILAGCYKFGAATLLRRGGATMTTVIEYEDSVEKSIDVYVKQYPHGFNSGFLYHNMCPAITKSSWEYNNFIIEVYE